MEIEPLLVAVLAPLLIRTEPPVPESLVSPALMKILPPGPLVPVPTRISILPAVPPVASPVINSIAPLGPASERPVINWMLPLTPLVPALAVSSRMSPLERFELAPDLSWTEPPVPPLDSPPLIKTAPPLSEV